MVEAIMTSPERRDRLAAAARDMKMIERQSQDPDVLAAIRLLSAGKLAQAEAALRPFLAKNPDHVAALCILGDIANRVGIYPESEKLFRRVLAIMPDFADAKLNLANNLIKENRAAEALVLFDEILDLFPLDRPALSAKLTMLGQMGEYDACARCYEAALAMRGDEAWLWVGSANLAKTVGRLTDSVEGYRRAIALDPTRTEAWWGLANLKVVKFSDDDIAAMEQSLAGLPAEDGRRIYLQFALGKALEDRKDFASSFRHYADANRLRRGERGYRPEIVSGDVDSSIALFTPEFFAARADWGAKDRDPIFILGMPRAGSTLVEQILASHADIEGTAELPDIPLLIQRVVSERWRDRRAAYPAILAELSADEVAELGAAYLRAAAVHRKTDRPLFIDKQPNNWQNIGFIRLILPNARIVDARRHAMSCCFSNFKQFYARGQAFSYSLTDMGHYYRDYVRLLAHFDAALPAHVWRVQHEALIADPEREIRALLDHIGLPFDPACLRFHENDRPVRTASSEQVRRPINSDAVDRWRDYEPWLGPLKHALGDLAPA
jgi:tetratricopeptide (TPR) repeat protein